MRQKKIISKKESQRLKKKAKKRKKALSTYAIAKRKAAQNKTHQEAIVSKKQAKKLRKSATRRKWYLTEQDIKRGKAIQKNEQVRPITKKNMFRAGLYCILAASENYIKQLKIYNSLLDAGFDQPRKIVAGQEDVEKIIKITRFPKQKFDRVCSFAIWWQNTDLVDKIQHDIRNKRKNEFKLRNQLAKNCPGLAYKGASLYLGKFGYEQIVPLDIWIIRYLRDLGYDIKEPDYKTVSGMKTSDYLKHEKVFRRIAKKYDMTPMLFQCALWGKYSTWKKPKKNAAACLDDF